MARDLPDTVTDTVQRVRDRYDRFRTGLDPRQQQLLQILVFLTKFTVLALPFWLVLHSGWEADAVRAVTAEASAAVLRGIGVDASATGHLLSAGDLLVDVTRDSTGWKSVMVFLALVTASRRPLRSKIGAAAAGTVALLVLNLGRVVSMVYAVVVFGIDYELLHTVLWRWGLTVAVIGLWTGWLWATTGSQPLSRWRFR